MVFEFRFRKVLGSNSLACICFPLCECAVCTVQFGLVWFVSPCANGSPTKGGVLKSMIYIVGPLPNSLNFWSRWFLRKRFVIKVPLKLIEKHINFQKWLLISLNLKHGHEYTTWTLHTNYNVIIRLY